jgi:hypothetical protein
MRIDDNNREDIIAKPKLERSKEDIKYKVKYEREDYYKRNLFCKEKISDIAITYGNEDIEECPYGAKEPRRRSP